jgi:hypothetical protein
MELTQRGYSVAKHILILFVPFSLPRQRAARKLKGVWIAVQGELFGVCTIIRFSRPLRKTSPEV